MIWAFTVIVGAVMIVPLLYGAFDIHALVACAVTILAAWSVFGREHLL